MYKLVIALALIGVVHSDDLQLGTRDLSTKIFDEDRKASPALWRRSTEVAIPAGEGEVISGIFVTDRRAKKDGVVEILDGGVRQKIVVLKLKSPAIFRGYDFHVEVFAQPGIQPRHVPAGPTFEEFPNVNIPNDNNPEFVPVDEVVDVTPAPIPAINTVVVSEDIPTEPIPTFRGDVSN